MLRPDSVSRVRPPKTTIPKTLAAEPSSQYATLLLLVSGNELVFVFFTHALGSLAMVWLSAPSGDEPAFEGAAAEELWRGDDCMR